MSILIERETSAGSAGARRATRDPAGRDAAGVEDPEVREQAKRRRFSAEYKLRIVREADAFGKGDGDVAALLRREGLYSSQLSSWRRQRDEIAKVGMTSRKRGRKAKAEDPRVKELERENARLQRRLARVETWSRRGTWHRSNRPGMTRAYPNPWFRARMFSLSDAWLRLHAVQLVSGLSLFDHEELIPKSRMRPTSPVL